MPVLPQPNTRSLISQTSQPGYIQGYDTQQGYAPVFVPKGQYVPGISATPNKMTTDSLQSSIGIKLPAENVASTAGANVMNAGAGETIKSIMASLTPPETETDIKQQDLLTQMASLVGEQANKAADQLTAEQSAGLPQLKQQFSEINTQILSKLAEDKALEASYQAANTAAEGNSGTLSRLQGQQAQNYRMYIAQKNEKAAEVGLLQAQALGLQGQIASAQSTADRAVDLKYSSIEANLNTYQAQLNALAPTLNKEEKQQALAQQVLLDQKKQEIADKKEKEKSIQSAMMDYFNAGGTDTKVANAISTAKTVEEAQRLAGMQVAKTVQEDRNLEIQLKKAQLSNIYSQISERDTQNQVVVDQRGGLVLKPEEALKINKELVNNDAYKAIKKGQDSLQYLLDFEKKFNEVGLETIPGKDKGDLSAKYTSSLLNLKEFFNLGVLNGPDLTVLEGIMPNPTKGVGWGPWGIIPWSKKLAGVKSATKAGIETLKNNISKTLDDRYQSLSSQYGDYSTQSLRSLGDLQRIYIQQKASLDPKLQKLIDENPNLQNEDIIQLITQP